MEPLTLRQVQVLRCVEQCVADRGIPPTRRELCAMLGMTSQRMLRDHLDALVRKGHLRVDDAVSRGLAVLVGSIDATLKPLAKARPRDAARKVRT